MSLADILWSARKSVAEWLMPARLPYVRCSCDKILKWPHIALRHGAENPTHTERAIGSWLLNGVDL